MKQKLLLSAALIFGFCQSLLFAQNAIVSIAGPQIVAPTGVSYVTVVYTATEASEILVILQTKSDNSWANQESRTVAVGEQVEVVFEFITPELVDSVNPTHHWAAFIKPVGGAYIWDGTSDTNKFQDVSVSAENLSVSKLDLKNNFLIFPNPVKTQFNVNLPEAGTVEVVSLNGKVLLTSKIKSPGLTTLNIENLSSGIYLCRYTSSNTTKTLKLVKE